MLRPPISLDAKNEMIMKNKIAQNPAMWIQFVLSVSIPSIYRHTVYIYTLRPPLALDAKNEMILKKNCAESSHVGSVCPIGVYP